MNWINAKDRQPDSNRRVLLWDPTFDKEPLHVGFWEERDRVFEIIDEGGYDTRYIGEVTHWMEMPPAPGKGA